MIITISVFNINFAIYSKRAKLGTNCPETVSNATDTTHSYFNITFNTLSPTFTK